MKERYPMEEKYPVLSERFQSILIDTVFIVILMFIAAGILDKMNNPPDWVRMSVFFVIWLGYEPICTSLGCTLGNYIKKQRVRRSDDITKRIDIFAAFLRYVVKFLLGGLSFLTIGANPKRRAIHDLAAESVMIKV
jgi:uncharacterized RDD family membrane protein YckC